MNRRLPTLAGAIVLLVVTTGSAAWAESPAPLRRQAVSPPRGPIEIRDEFLFAQPRLSLPAISPDALGWGRTELRLHLNWGNDFSFSQRGPAEAIGSDRRFLADGEHRTLEVGLRHGVLPGLDLGVRVPLRWRGAGFLDDVIDWFHDWTGTLDNDRPKFATNRYRLQGRDGAFNRFNWDPGLGLGNVELEARWAFLRSCACREPRAAVVARMTLPTGNGPFETEGIEAGLQIVGAYGFPAKVDLYGGVGGTWFSEPWLDGVEYTEWQVRGFLAVEWRPFRAWSFFLQTDASSRLISNVPRYPSVQWYIHAGAKADIGGPWQIEFGFTENLEDQQSTVDIGVFFGLVGRF